MKAIHAGQRVRIEGRRGAFLVLHVDQQRNLADVMSLGSVRKVETGVSLATLLPLDESPETDGATPTS